VIDWTARHPTAANLLMIAIVVLGISALPSTNRETLPHIANDKVEVMVEYRGAAPEDVESAICRRLEDALDSVTNLDELRCEAVEGRGTATAIMREGAEITRFLDDISAAVDTIDDFPATAATPVVAELGRTDAVISVAVTGPEDPVILKAYAESLKRRMMSLPNVADITIKGFSKHQLAVEVPGERLRRFGLSFQSLGAAIQSHSVDTPGGRLEGTQEDMLLRFDDRRRDVDTMRSLPIITDKHGATIRLGDIATVTDQFDRAEEKIEFNGRRAALLRVTKTLDQDVLLAHSDIVKFVARERRSAPAGIELTLTQDVSSVVQDRLNMLVVNGVQGLALVFVVLWLFFSLRYSFWVTMGLPVSFLGALFLLPMLGVTINMISMVGLLIGIGLLMDDAIVIAENIAARMAGGDTPVHAAVEGTRQVLPGIMSSFMTTLMVFGSLAFISGELGQILRVMPIVLITVLTVSLVEAFLILPNHLAHSLSHMRASKPSRFREAFERHFDTLREQVFGRALDWAVRNRYATIGIAAMLVILSVSVLAGGGLKFVGFPDLDGNVIEARVLTPQGTPLARTQSIVHQLEAALARVNERYKSQQPDGVDLVRNRMVIFGENPNSHERGPHVARVVVDLLDAEIRTTLIADITAAWRAETGPMPDVIAVAFAEPAIGPGGRAIDVRFTGPRLIELKAAAREFQQWLGQYAGVLNLTDDLRPGKREFQFKLNPGAGALGLSSRSVADELRGAFQGIKVDQFPVGAETYEVNLRLSAAERASVQDLDDFSVTTSSGAQIPLRVAAHVEESRGWARIHRIDGARVVTVQGDVDGNIANSQELIGLASGALFADIERRYPGLKISVEGESASSAETGQSIITNVVLGLIGVYLLLALQFRGYAMPVTVLAVIPTALIGVVFGHWIQGLDLSMPSIIGMASLFGVVVNDAILLVVFIRTASEQGVAVEAAARKAGRARFRPIILTSITTIAGLTPLLAETSLQAQILIPLASSLAFGLTAATLAALFIVPAVYTALDDFGVAQPRKSEHDATLAT
jgi:hydrophobic/amphiphilic exporter-1 (mainly G- bacteria), HAE1 family